MRYGDISELTVSAIMRQWPETIGVFLAYGLHCIGCPIGGFHTLRDAAAEHRVALEELTKAVQTAISESAATAGPALRHRR